MQLKNVFKSLVDTSTIACFHVVVRVPDCTNRKSICVFDVFSARLNSKLVQSICCFTHFPSHDFRLRVVLFFAHFWWCYLTDVSNYSVIFQKGVQTIMYSSQHIIVGVDVITGVMTVYLKWIDAQEANETKRKKNLVSIILFLHIFFGCCCFTDIQTQTDTRVHVNFASF